MLIEEPKFRRLCRGEYGGFEGARFQEALDEHPGEDPVPVVFEETPFSGDEPKMFRIVREEVELYARIAKEERQPEADLTEQIKPQMREWIMMNRHAMCRRLKKALEPFKPDVHNGVTIVWETATPDKVDYEVVKKYLEAYGNER